MYISARERQILEILLTTKEEVTVKDLANEIGVSGRTIHRDLKNVEDILKEYQLTLHKKSGVGVQLTGDKDRVKELELFLFNLSYSEYTPDERQTMILCELLETDGPVKLVSLANDLNVTIATVSADLTKLEERLKHFGLSLIRRRGYGVEIAGDEGAKRRTMSSLISEYLDESELLSLTRENIQKRSTQQINTISERLMGLVEKNKLVIVEKVVESIVQELPFAMADSAYIGLVVHVALAVERIQKGEGISIDPGYLEEQQLTKEYPFAKKIVSQLEQVFNISIPEAEVAYITMHLKGAKLRHAYEYFPEDSSLQVAIKTKNLIDCVGKLSGVDLTENRSLFEGLVMHLKPAVYRLKQKMGISNPLLDRIKRDYADLFSIVKQAVDQVFHEFYVPDEEIGYLVMHFGAALMGRRSLENVKTLVVCSSGIGTSKMLATKLQQEFPELSHIRNVSVKEFEKINKDDYQIVISTIPIPDYQPDYIVVSPLLTVDEIEKIRSFIYQYQIVNNTESRIPVKLNDRVSKRSTSQLMEEMFKIQEYAKTVREVLEGFELVDIPSFGTVIGILQQVCLRLVTQEKADDAEAIINALKERERLGGLGIPETAMALYHTRSPHVIKSTFAIYTVPNPIGVKGMDGQKIEMEHFILMLSPENASEQALEVLSYISSLLIENEENIRVFQSKSHDRIIELLTSRLDQFITTKLKELRSEP